MRNLTEVFGNEDNGRDKLPKRKVEEIVGKAINVKKITILPSNFENGEYAIITAKDMETNEEFVFFSCKSMLNQIKEWRLDELVDDAYIDGGVLTEVEKKVSKKNGKPYYVFKRGQ